MGWRGINRIRAYIKNDVIIMTEVTRKYQEKIEDNIVQISSMNDSITSPSNNSETLEDEYFKQSYQEEQMNLPLAE